MTVLLQLLQFQIVKTVFMMASNRTSCLTAWKCVWKTVHSITLMCVCVCVYMHVHLQSKCWSRLGTWQVPVLGCCLFCCWFEAADTILSKICYCKSWLLSELSPSNQKVNFVFSFFSSCLWRLWIIYTEFCWFQECKDDYFMAVMLPFLSFCILHVLK